MHTLYHLLVPRQLTNGSSTKAPHHENAHANSKRPVVCHDIWPSFPAHFTAFYVQAGEYILLRAPDMVSAFGMDSWC